ncbi:MAG: hypothetical protein LBU34_12360 [Planctomycetaceae bacterium]|jgi:hypothetical protein|nr:hypothetical protein [Planctomycetaceae bacterium]
MVRLKIKKIFPKITGYTYFFNDWLDYLVLEYFLCPDEANAVAGENPSASGCQSDD